MSYLTTRFCLFVELCLEVIRDYKKHNSVNGNY
jgi:hypothetical protein